MANFSRNLIGLMLLLAAAAWGGPALAQAPPEDGETPGTAPIALVEEAYVAHRKGDYDGAIQGYTKIIQRRGLTKRERAISYLLRGEAKRDAGRLDDAAVDFTRALRQWPGYPQAFFFRGRVYETQGKLKEAYADVTRALALEPGRQAYETNLMVLKKRLGEAGVDLRQLGSAPEPVNPPLPLEDK